MSGDKAGQKKDDKRKIENIGTEEVMERLCGFFCEQAALLDRASYSTIEKFETVWCVVRLLVLSIAGTNRAIPFITKSGGFAASLVLGRMVLETLINACYILAEGESTAELALRHANQKSYRDLERKLQVGDFHLSLSHPGKIEPQQDSDLTHALNEFTSAKGREKNWTNKTVKERLEVIDKIFGTEVSGQFSFAFFGLYNNSSELVHGTVYGALFALGVTSPGESKDFKTRGENHQRSNLSMSLLLLGNAINAFLVAVGKKIGKDELINESNASIKQINAYLTET